VQVNGSTKRHARIKAAGMHDSIRLNDTKQELDAPSRAPWNATQEILS